MQTCQMRGLPWVERETDDMAPDAHVRTIKMYFNMFPHGNVGGTNTLSRFSKSSLIVHHPG